MSGLERPDAPRCAGDMLDHFRRIETYASELADWARELAMHTAGIEQVMRRDGYGAKLSEDRAAEIRASAKGIAELLSEVSRRSGAGARQVALSGDLRRKFEVRG